MKTLLLATTVLLLVSCNKSGDKTGGNHHEDGDSISEDANRALYDQVMDLHNEVMPKMEDLYSLKKELLEKIAKAPGIAPSRKKEIEDIIAGLDSANKAMMDWMHDFKPLPSTADQENAREYLENEMESIKKVRDLTNETLEKAKAIKEMK